MVQFCIFMSGHLSRSRDCAWLRSCQLKHRLQHPNCLIIPQKVTRMPSKKHFVKARNKNLEKARNVTVQRSKGEICEPLQLWFLLTATYVENKDEILPNRPPQPAVEETEVEEPHGCLEIVEQSELDHFSSILQKAQALAAEAERKKPHKHLKRYDGKSTRTLKQQKNFREDLAKQGYLPVFEFMAHMEETAKKRAHMEQLVTRAVENEQVLEESAPEELDTEDLVSKRTRQVHHQGSLMHWYWWMRPACSQRRGGGWFWGHNKQLEWERWWAPWSRSWSSTGCQWNPKSNPGAPWEPPLWMCPSGRIPTSPSQ